MDILSAIKKCIMFGKATFLCLAYALIIAMAGEIVTQNTNRIEIYNNLLKESLKLVVLI